MKKKALAVALAMTVSAWVGSGVATAATVDLNPITLNPTIGTSGNYKIPDPGPPPSGAISNPDTVNFNLKPGFTYTVSVSGISTESFNFLSAQLYDSANNAIGGGVFTPTVVPGATLFTYVISGILGAAGYYVNIFHDVTASTYGGTISVTGRPNQVVPIPGALPLLLTGLGGLGFVAWRRKKASPLAS